MTDNIKVEPARDVSAVDVATDDIGGTHYPVYKMAIGEDGLVTLISTSNPMPITNEDGQDTNQRNQLDDLICAVNNLVDEQKITNLHLAEMRNETLTKLDLEK